MIYRKMIYGCVVQMFNDDGKCISQRFEPERRNFDYETSEGDEIHKHDMPLRGKENFPYMMRQPNN